MNRTELVNQIFKELEENHIYLYHDISKEEFEKHKQEFLKNVEELDEDHFDGGMLKLFALFKDAHLFYEVNFNYVEATIKLIGKDFYIKNDKGIYKKIEKINGYKIDEVVEKLKQLVAYETETWAYRSITTSLISSPKAMNMIDCGSEKDLIQYSCEDEDFLITEMHKPQPKKRPFYESEKVCNNEILYIKYRVCRDMEKYPFIKFVEDISRSFEKLPKACLVDVRNNVGGNDVVVYPLIEWLKKYNIKTYVLMNEGTFSSGTFALADFKKQLKAKLLGTEAGQPTRQYGNTRWLKVGDKEFSACERYFELTSCHDENAPVQPNYIIDAFDYEGVITPDIRIETKVEDLNKGVDTQLTEALKIIQKEASCDCENNI